MLRYVLYTDGESFVWKIRDRGPDNHLRVDGLAFNDLYCVRNYIITKDYVHSNKTEFFIISEQNSIFFGQEFKQDII